MINTMRRKLLQGAGAMTLACALPQTLMAFPDPLRKRIPSSGELLNPVGLGSWITFNVGRNRHMLNNSARIIKRFLAMGGQMIDSSPMYGSSEKTIGVGLDAARYPTHLFSASKTWSSSVSKGREQFSDSQQLWGLEQFDLMQIHNLLAWRDQLAMLRELKQDKLIRYIGVTTSHGRRHAELKQILEQQEIDFVQLTYNISDTVAEQRLIPTAADNGVAVIANRPYQGGNLFRQAARHAAPGFAREFGVNDWPSFFLRYILSNPGLTCAIPATSQIAHLEQNMAASNNMPLPDTKMRTKMLNYWNNL